MGMVSLMDSDTWAEEINYDKGYEKAYVELWNLHLEKSRRYGSDRDRLGNLTAVGTATDMHGSYYPILRVIEKCQRVLELLDAGEYEEIEEFLDIAGLALCAEAMNRREIHANKTDGTNS